MEHNSMSAISPEELLRAAANAAANAHCPYSHYRVGAAILASDGQLFCGCNVENASYGLTLCAERTAIFTAVAAGCLEFDCMAIVADGDSFPYPCGACRQVLAEFCKPDFIIHVAMIDKLHEQESHRLDSLLPKGFKL